jgi:1-acyl-sn-glycerol-3-phosphate acyltransferase
MSSQESKTADKPSKNKKKKKKSHVPFPLWYHIWYGAWWIWLRVTAGVMYRMQYVHNDRIPREGGLLMVSNHQSNFDPPMVGCGVWHPNRYMAKKSLFKNFFFGTHLKWLGAFPIDRDGVGLEGVKTSLGILKDGQRLVVFPEGGRTEDGEVQSFMSGAVMLARRGKTQIVPAAIEGPFDIYPRGCKIPKLWGKIVIGYGEVIPYEDYKDLNDEDFVELLETAVRKVHAELCELPSIKRQRAKRKLKTEA